MAKEKFEHYKPHVNIRYNRSRRPCGKTTLTAAITNSIRQERFSELRHSTR